MEKDVNRKMYLNRPASNFILPTQHFFLSPGPSLHFYIITFVQLLPIAQLLFDLLFLLQIVVFLSHLTCL